MYERKRLSDVLHGSALDDLAANWSETAPATDHAPLPVGTYRCSVVDGALFQAKTGTPGYKLTLEVIDGDHAHRRLWYDVWLSAKAMPTARRDLGRLGVATAAQLDAPLPAGFVVDAKVAIETLDDGRTFNRVRSFAVVGFEPPAPDAFAPVEPTPEPAPEPTPKQEFFEL